VETIYVNVLHFAAETKFTKKYIRSIKQRVIQFTTKYTNKVNPGLKNRLRSEHPFGSLKYEMRWNIHAPIKIEGFQIDRNLTVVPVTGAVIGLINTSCSQFGIYFEKKLITLCYQQFQLKLS
jgi:hypothetical protein